MSETLEANLKLRPAWPAARRGPALRPARWQPNLAVGAFLVGLLVLAAALAPLLSPYPPSAIQPEARLQAPSLAHPFGTDDFGRDLLSRVLYGARPALQVSLLSVLLAAVPGITLGLLAGYRAGPTDQVLSRVMDAWLAFPGLLLAIVLVARLRPSTATVAIALGIAGVPGYFRLVRAGTLSAGLDLHVEAARAIGAGTGRILLYHILPTLASPVVVVTTIRLGAMLVAASGLSFIGLGAQPPEPEWGALMATGRDYLGTAWWLTVFPGLAITASVMGLNLLGDGLRDALDPATRRHGSNRSARETP